jgi:hypothetical protein
MEENVGDFPPNSIVTGIIFSAVVLYLRPVSSKPVNESLAIRFEVAKLVLLLLQNQLQYLILLQVKYPYQFH